MEACEELLNFMLEPATSIAVAEGQNYPPVLTRPRWSLVTRFRPCRLDKTGTLDGLTLRMPVTGTATRQIRAVRTYPEKVIDERARHTAE
ncbi:MAG: hypothetical protein R3E89_05000 [Thiolinea sp.]